MVAEISQPNITRHYVSVGDAQKAGENVAQCTCGVRYQNDSHATLMHWAYWHNANACLTEEEIDTFTAGGS